METEMKQLGLQETNHQSTIGLEDIYVRKMKHRFKIFNQYLKDAFSEIIYIHQPIITQTIQLKRFIIR